MASLVGGFVLAMAAIGFSCAFIGVMLLITVGIIAHHYDMSILDVLRSTRRVVLSDEAISPKTERPPGR